LNIDTKLKEFIIEYGERACILLKAIYEESSSQRELKLGDFSVKGLKSKLKSWGIDYNPIPLILKLEKELNIIETSYRSTTQRWWRILDRGILERALRECNITPQHRILEDSRARILKIQLHILKPWEILGMLKNIQSKNTMTKSDLELVKRIAFNELPILIKIKEEAESLGYNIGLREELEVVERIIEVLEEVVLRKESSENKIVWEVRPPIPARGEDI